MGVEGTYVLPLRTTAPAVELTDYLNWLCTHVDEVIVVDGSPPEVFAIHALRWPDTVIHVAPMESTPNGKVGGVLTGLALAGHDRVVIADDDVRYGLDDLRQVLGLLERADVVRPTNHFQPGPCRPLPWHAVIDTGRTLLNRWAGGDWPGTVGVRRSALPYGYAGDVMFENLEMVRTVRAAGGREVLAHDCYVRRLPPTTSQFLDQRVRQAYDEFARPLRLVAALAVVPGMISWRRRPRRVAIAAAGVVGLAEAGRRRAGGRAVYPPLASIAAPIWVLERGVASWLAVWSRVRHGGVRYDGRVLVAATPVRQLRDRLSEHPGASEDPRMALTGDHTGSWVLTSPVFS